MVASVNVARCEMEPLWERGRFRATYHDLTEALGGAVIGATVFEIEAGFTSGPHHFHDGIEEWLYVVTGEPTLRDRGGRRPLTPGTLVAFQAGPDGAHSVDGPGRIVMFSAGARGWGEAFTSVYPDADKIGGKPGVQFIRGDAVETWPEPAIVPVPAAPAGPCPQVDLLAVDADDRPLAERLATQTWVPSLLALRAGESTGSYEYDWCRERWVLVVAGAPVLRRPGGRTRTAAGDIVCLPEGESGARQFVNDTGEDVRLLICSAPAAGPSATVAPDEDAYVLRVPGQAGYRFALGDQLEDYWDGEPGAAAE